MRPAGPSEKDDGGAIPPRIRFRRRSKMPAESDDGRRPAGAVRSAVVENVPSNSCRAPAMSNRTDRRTFLARGAAALAVGASSERVAGRRFAEGEEPPPVVDPRATSGDDVFEPDWKERLTITVGRRNADLEGMTDRALQAAVDYAARLGGGTVRILPGKYVLRNAVRLASNVRIVGSGDDTILAKHASVATKLAANSDWYDQEITLADADGFAVGDGVCLRTKRESGGGDVVKRTLVARDGNRFKLDRPLRENFWLSGEATAATLFALFDGDHVRNVAVEDLALDGNRAENDLLDGNYAGCVFLQDCNRVALRNLTARNYHGDGLSWQICHDVTVENCRSTDHSGLGLHPGSGSQRTVMRRNVVERCDIGIFFCWGVKFGLPEKNTVRDVRKHGISIGHHDNHNLIVDNLVERSGVCGVLFRPERGEDFAPHRNRLERNVVIDSGGENAAAVDVQGRTRDVVIANNELRETRGPAARTGIRLGPETQGIRLSQNRISGFRREVEGAG